MEEGLDKNDDELSLPKVAKLINEMMPEDIVCAKDARDIIAECCVEFIHLLSSEANDICEKEAKKTIAGDHVLKALESLGFQDYVDEVQGVFNLHSKQIKEREKRVNKMEESGLTEQELIKAQEELFAQSRMRLQQGEPSS